MQDYEVLQTAIDHYGSERQIDKAIEEMSELTKALLKLRLVKNEQNTESVLEEMADVEIMLDQLKLIFGYKTLYRDEKVYRLVERLHEEGVTV